MKCEICESDYAESYYKNAFDETICEDCLLELDGIETNKITQYFLDGEYMGDDTEIQEVIDNICDNLNIKEVKESE